MKRIELTQKDIEDFKLNMSEIEEKHEELNTSITALYMWIERMELKLNSKQKN